MGQLISRTDPLGTVRYGYDRAGHQIRTVDVDGQETAVRVDATGRVVGVDVPGASADARYAYTPAGLVTKMTDATGTTRFSYDARGLTTQVVHTPGTGAPGAGSVLKYGYDETGRLTSLTYPNGATLTRGLDAAGRLTSITDPTAGRFNLTWGPDGNLATITYPNGVVTTADVDSRGLTTTLTIADDAGAALLGMAYDYDAAGQQTSITTTRPHIGDWPAPPGATTNETSEFSTSSQYTFDPLGRLDQVTGDGAGDVDFAVNGVLTALPGLTLTHNQLGQAQAATRTTPTAATTWDFSYDPAGRQTTRTYQTTPADPGQPTVSGQVTLTWDTAGHLMTWADTPAGAAEPAEEYAYTYTGDGLRRTTTHHTAGADPMGSTGLCTVQVWHPSLKSPPPTPVGIRAGWLSCTPTPSAASAPPPTPRVRNWSGSTTTPMATPPTPPETPKPRNSGTPANTPTPPVSPTYARGTKPGSSSPATRSSTPPATPTATPAATPSNTPTPPGSTGATKPARHW